jgi:hypothetical protein
MPNGWGLNMSSNAKSNNKKMPMKSPAIIAKHNGNQKQIMADKTSINKYVTENESILSTASNIESLRPDLYDAADQFIDSDLYTLRYNINEKGIGQLLLPPSLSILLQSERVRVSPTAGGIFIKSI